MVAFVTDPLLEQELIAQRQQTGADRLDEVWEGVYVMAPLPNTEHQSIVSRLTSVFCELFEWPGLGSVMAGVNVSDRETDWKENYRVPDVVVALQDGSARDCATHWFGGPDFLVEVLSKDDQTRKKIPFYAKIGTREMLLVDRNRWCLELLRLKGDELVTVGRSELPSSETIRSEVLPLSFRLVAAEPRPQIEAVHAESGHHGLV